MLFPTALSSTKAISLSRELNNSTLANSSLKFEYHGGDALFLGILSSPKSISSSSSNIPTFSGYPVLLLLLLLLLYYYHYYQV